MLQPVFDSRDWEFEHYDKLELDNVSGKRCKNCEALVGQDSGVKKLTSGIRTFAWARMRNRSISRLGHYLSS